MHVGPSIGNSDVQAAGAVPNVGFASPEFNEAMKFSLLEYMKVTGADDSYTPFILPGGGTVAMESTMSFLRKDAKVLVVSNGAFGDRWEKILSRYPVEFKILRTTAGNSVQASQVKAEVEEGHYDMVTFTHVETSTGVRVPLKEMVNAARPYVDLIVVDGVASIGGERMNSSEWNIDVCLTASQKALGAQTGAGLLVASERAISKLDEPSISGFFLDLRNWLPVMRAFLSGKGGYFATPPIGTIFSLKKSFEIIEEETMDNRLERHRICSEAFRKGIKEMGLEIVAAEGLRSNTVTGVYLEGVSIPEFLSKGIAAGVEFAAGVHEQIKDRYFRVGHMGWIYPAQIIKAIEVIESSVSSLGGNVNSGSVEAARDVLEKLS